MPLSSHDIARSTRSSRAAVCQSTHSCGSPRRLCTAQRPHSGSCCQPAGGAGGLPGHRCLRQGLGLETGKPQGARKRNEQRESSCACAAGTLPAVCATWLVPDCLSFSRQWHLAFHSHLAPATLHCPPCHSPRSQGGAVCAVLRRLQHPDCLLCRRPRLPARHSAGVRRHHPVRRACCLVPFLETWQC